MAQKTGEPVYVYVNGVLIGTCQSTIMDKWDMTNDITILEQYLQEAISNEAYEDAAQIRDRINELIKP